MTQPRLPLPRTTSGRLLLGIEASRAHLANRKGSILSSEEDWVAAVALSTTRSNRTGDHPVDVACKVALWKEGLDIVADEAKRMEILLHAAAVLGGEGSPSPSMSERVSALKASAEKKRRKKKEDAEILYQKILPLLPEGRRLLEHQKEALVEIKERNYRLVVHDDLGLGKTIEVLVSALLRSVEGKDPFPLLISAQTSMIGAWIEHVELWLEKLSPRVDTSFGGAGNVVAMPYGKLLDRWREAKEFAAKTVVYDESHYLKNPEAQRSKGAILCSSSAESVLCTTATMDPNGRPQECFMQLKLCDPSLEWRDFRFEYCNAFKMKVGDREVWNTKGSSNPVKLGKLLHKMSFRRTKAELGKELELPELSRFVIPVRLGVRAVGALEKEKTAVITRLGLKAAALRETGKKRDELKAGRIEEASLLAATTILRYKVEELKIPAAMQRTKELLEEGHDVILFFFFPRNAIRMFEELSAEFPDTQVLLGTSDLDQDKRTELVKQAQKKGGIIVLTYAYCEGITLTRFDRVLFVGRHWIPDKETQAEARVDRIGQVRTTAAEYLVARSTSDEAMGQIATTKETVARSIVGSTAVRLFRWLQDRPADLSSDLDEVIDDSALLGDMDEGDLDWEIS